MEQYENYEFEVKDFKETIEAILESDELEIDGILVTNKEKKLIREMNDSIVEIIRERRL